MNIQNALNRFERIGLTFEKSHNDEIWEVRLWGTTIAPSFDSIQSALSYWETQQYELMISKEFIDALVAKSRQWNRKEVEAVIDWLSRAEAPYASALIHLRGQMYSPKDAWRSEATEIMARHGVSLAKARTGIRLEAASILQAQLGSETYDGKQAR
ncbi:hypothetical protein [Xanthomonas axonopodis]